jgi:hypothetical protein
MSGGRTEAVPCAPYCVLGNNGVRTERPEARLFIFLEKGSHKGQYFCTNIKTSFPRGVLYL